jgi:cell migration-inducing and hyaluronan-binding protein
LTLRWRVRVFFIAATLLLAQLPAVAAESGPISARNISGIQKWSDPATWNGSVPAAGQKVTIPSNATVVLDTDTASLTGLQIDGTLRFAERDVELTSKYVIVHGTLRIGSADNPFKPGAVITLTGAESEQDVMDMGTKVLGVMGGTLDLHGRKTKGWTRLAATAQPGATQIELASAPNWRAGDRIVIASSDYWRHHDDEATIVSRSGTTVQLDRALTYRHWGELQTFAGQTVDERAEVGLLTRNIVVRGDDSSTEGGFGAHTMIMEGGIARIEGVEFTNVGQRKRLRRYPVHFHMDGDAPGSYLKRSSIHHSFNRCVTVHGTNRLKIQGNVCFEHVGHGFFLEDGAETDNVITGNLGLGTKSLDNGLLPTDRNPATFWITNPDNIVRNNVAAGSDGFGFWYALPEHPTGLSNRPDIWPRRTPLGAFDNNVAHSNGDRGLNVDSGPRPDGETEATYYSPREIPGDGESADVVARFDHLTAYMNRDRGVWLRGENHVVSNAVLADNRSGATFASSESFLENSLVVGETANKGMTEDWEDAGINGRALPFFWEPDVQITGFEFYDGRVGVKNTTFVNFKENSLRPSGALGYLAPDAFSIDPKNFAEAVTFVDSTPVYLATPEAGMDGDMAKVFIDKDGSVTGTAGKAVVVDNPFLHQVGCQARPAWTAYVCPNDYVSMYVSTGGDDPSYIKPLTLTRDDAVTQTLMGCCDDSTDVVTSIIPNRAYGVNFNSATPSDVRFVLWRGSGKWLQVSLPMTGSFTVKRWGWAIPQVQSLEALAKQTESSYFYSSTTSKLHLKIVAEDTDWEEIRIKSV